MRHRFSSHKSPVQYARQYVMDIPGDAGGLVHLISLQLTSEKNGGICIFKDITVQEAYQGKNPAGMPAGTEVSDKQYFPFEKLQET